MLLNHSERKNPKKIAQCEFLLMPISPSLSDFLSTHDIKPKHTLDLPKMNTTPDPEIIRFADDENRIVISKDSDFLDNYILDRSQKKLLNVSNGNINN